MGVSSEYTTKEHAVTSAIKPHVRGCSMVYTSTDHDHVPMQEQHCRLS